MSYFYVWQGLNDVVPWDIQPDDYVLVHYAESDADLLYRSWLASEGAPPHHIYLPLVTCDWP